MSSDRFVTPVPLPTPYQAEIAQCLAEECAEVTQRAMKLNRFGVLDVQSGQELNNRERLSDEVGDLLEVIDWAYGAGIIDLKRAIAHKPNKRVKLLKYLQHAPDSPPDPDPRIAAHNLALEQAAVILEDWNKSQSSGIHLKAIAAIRARKIGV